MRVNICKESFTSKGHLNTLKSVSFELLEKGREHLRKQQTQSLGSWCGYPFPYLFGNPLIFESGLLLYATIDMIVSIE